MFLLGIVLIPLLGNVFWYYSIFTNSSFWNSWLFDKRYLFHRFFILPKKKLNEELRKDEEEKKTQLMDELEAEERSGESKKIDWNKN